MNGNLIALSLLCVLVTQGCGQSAFLPQVANLTSAGTVLRSGDILVVSGGTVSRTTTPFPLHQISAFYSDGRFKSVVRTAAGTDLYMGASMSTDLSKLLYTVDGTDRVERVNISDTTNYGNHLLDTTNLTGATLRTVATLADGGTIVAESTTSIEKYDSSGNRITTGGFPITLTANIMKLRKISGGRWVAITTGGVPDSPRVYSDAGTLLTTISLGGLACTTNCDPSDILELSDGRFLIAIQAAALQSLELYSSTFTYIGRFYQNTSLLQNISAIAQLRDGDVVACNTGLSTCEKLQIVGSAGVRVGSTAFIGDSSVMRQPTDVMVVP